MHTDPISDMLTRIRNASMAKKIEVLLPYSKIKHEIARSLAKNKYIEEVKKISASNKDGNNHDELWIKIKYDEGRPAITKINRISTPGRRVYASKDELPYVLNNLGIAIISTPQGLMTNKEARKRALGGEIICEVY